MITEKHCSRCDQNKNFSAFAKNISYPDGLQAWCRECRAAFHQENKDRTFHVRAAFRAKHRLKIQKEKKRYRDKNLQRIRLQQAAYYVENKRKYAKRNAERRCIKRHATPSWANHFFIEEAYDLAQLRTKATGIEWHVDHIVPLLSKKVCGLHVENNLRVISAQHNRSKGNRHWPDMP